MNNGSIFNLLNVIIRKEKEGDTITPQDYSDLLYMCSEEKANAAQESGQWVEQAMRRQGELDTVDPEFARWVMDNFNVQAGTFGVQGSFYMFNTGNYRVLSPSQGTP